MCSALPAPTGQLDFILGTLGSHFDLGFQRSLWLLHGETIIRESCSKSREKKRSLNLRDKSKN